MQSEIKFSHLFYHFWTLQQFSAAYFNIPLLSHAHNTIEPQTL